MLRFDRLRRLPEQLAGDSPFSGSLRPRRLPALGLFRSVGRNFRTPLAILDDVFRHPGDLHYLDVPGFPPILFVRDPELIRAIALETALGGAFDRDTLPTQGIARVVGGRNLLFAQGEVWRQHRAAASRPMGTRAVQAEGVFHDLERHVADAATPAVAALAARVAATGANGFRIRLEPEIQAVMLTVLVNVLFGANLPPEELRTTYLPAIQNVIRYILWDTLLNQLRLPVFRIPAIAPGHAQLQRDRRTFEDLVSRVLAARDDSAGFWPLLTASGPEEALRSNVRVFLAGALEATASFIGWTISNLARHPDAQRRAYDEVAAQPELTPEARAACPFLQRTFEETLRLNGALYFLPRVAMRNTVLEVSAGTLAVPGGTHVVLATYHANRCERHWGIARTGYPAAEFHPERWEPANLATHGRTSKDTLHFGFGHGPRVCIGRHFSEAEAFVCLSLFLRCFEFRAVQAEAGVASGISTRPADGVELDLSLRYVGERKIGAAPSTTDPSAKASGPQ
jgi:cytochrome P450